MRFVGNIVGSGSRRPDPEKVRALLNLPKPTTRKQLKSVLGMFNYHRTFIDHFAEIAKPLTDLTASNIPFILPWTDREEEAFESLKRK